MLSIQPDPGSSRVAELKDSFFKKFEQAPQNIVQVPGRVNIIGEHIDYCGYGVLPMAIEPSILVAVAARNNKIIHLANTDEEKYPSYELRVEPTNINIDGSKPLWWKYFLCGIKGVIEDIAEFSWPSGMEIMISGTIPPASGLSSSSALVVAGAMTTLVMSQNLDRYSRSQLADLCAKSERFIGTQGGGMDQATELLAEEGCAQLIEFNPLQTTRVELPKGAQFVILNSLAEANKAAGSEFNQRVVECRLATKLLAKKLGLTDWKTLSKLKQVQIELGKSLEQMLKDVENLLHPEKYTKEELADLLEMKVTEINQNILTPNTSHLTEFKLYQRAYHVYSEASRVYQYQKACSNHGSLTSLGCLMNESHESCQKMYECSHPKLDTLAEISRKNGAYGARLTGAGWGGCIVALIPEEKTQSFINAMIQDYYENCPPAKGLRPNSYIFPTIPGQGAAIYN